MLVVKPENVSKWTGAIIDVREPAEVSRERLDLAGLEFIPLGQVAARMAGRDRGAPVLMMCRSGVRSRGAAQQLESMGFTQVATLEGGLNACKAAGLPIITGKGVSIPIIRQVLIVASTFLLGGLALAQAVHPGFIVLSWFVGFGLMVAGVTGFCPMQYILERMPWNQTGKAPAATPSCCAPASAKSN